MEGLSAIIFFIEEKRKLLSSLFITIAVLSATIVGALLVQHPQIFSSRAAGKTTQQFSPAETDVTPDPLLEFSSPKGWYKLAYNPNQWAKAVETDPVFESRVIFNLRQEYGYARVDIIEGESAKELIDLKNEIVQASPLKPTTEESTPFKSRPSYLLTYQEKVLGEESPASYYQQIIKVNNKFLILEKRSPSFSHYPAYPDSLLNGIFFDDQESPEIKSASDSKTDLSTIELVDLIRPSIVNIIHTFCVDIVNLNPQTSGLVQNKYDFCGLSKGSGFVVNEQGVIATNGHIAKIYPEEGLATNLLTGANKGFAADLIRAIYASTGLNPPPNQVEDFYMKIGSNPQYLDHILRKMYQLINKQAISIRINSEKFYINAGNEPIKTDYHKINSKEIREAVIPSSTTYTADLLDFNYPNRYSYDAIINKRYPSGSDVALLRINNPSGNFLPVLELGDTQNLREGYEILIAGYPVLVEGGENPQAPISFKSSAKPTITRGIISAIKEDASGKTVLQTDASIDHGNSGGPAINSSGEVVGIATFFFESKSGNFNFLRAVADIKELLSKNNIENRPGKLTTTWRNALTKFRKSYYKEAATLFQQVQALSPTHPTIREFIKASNESTKKGENFEGLSPTNVLLAAFGGISLGSFITAGFINLSPLLKKIRQ